MPSSLDSQEKYDKQGHIIVVGGSYLKCLKKVRILSRVDVADGRIARQNLKLVRDNWRNLNLKPDDVVHTQSMPISQEGITATQEPSRDSDQRVSTNYTQLTILRSIKKSVDVASGETRPNIESLCVLIICNLVELFHRNEDPDGRINLRN